MVWTGIGRLEFTIIKVDQYQSYISKASDQFSSLYIKVVYQVEGFVVSEGGDVDGTCFAVCSVAREGFFRDGRGCGQRWVLGFGKSWVVSRSGWWGVLFRKK